MKTNMRFPLTLAIISTIPFIIMSLAIAFRFSGDMEATLQLLLGYAVIIFSFLAGIHWGLAISYVEDNPKRATLLFAESMIATLLAWLLMFMAELYMRVLGFAFLYAIIWGIDSVLFTHKIIPLWFFNLRGIVTPIVVVSMYVTYFSII